MKIAIASDHGGFELKEKIKKELNKKDKVTVDLGPDSKDSVDFSDYADKLCEKILSCDDCKGILICTTGQGMVMAANRHEKIRATLCPSKVLAKQAREHLDSNVLVLGGKTCIDDPIEILDVWLDTEFLEKRRYKRRLSKLDKN